MANKRLTARAQAARNQALVVDRARGLRWSTVAERHNVSTRQAQKIWIQWRESEVVETDDTEAQLKDEIAFLDAAIEEIAQLAITTGNDSVRLGALKAKVDAQARRLELKRVCGLLPWDLRNAKLEGEVVQINSAFEAARAKLGLELKPEVVDELWETMRDLFRVDPAAVQARKENEKRQQQLQLERERRRLQDRTRTEREA